MRKLACTIIISAGSPIDPFPCNNKITKFRASSIKKVAVGPHFYLQHV